MKTILGVSLFIFLWGNLISAQAMAGSQTVALDIKGMSCSMCAAKIENAVKKIEGVTKCLVDFKTGKGTVEFDDSKASVEKVIEACNKTGFKCNKI